MIFDDVFERKKASAPWGRYQQLMRERPEAFLQDENLMIETDLAQICDFEKESGRTIGVVYESPYTLMVVDLVYDQFGHRFAYERLLPAVPHGAVVMIPRCGDRYILLKQFRHALRGRQYAFPRGFGEPGLSAEENAAKELSEEISADNATVKPLGTVVADSGLSGNLVQVFECEVFDFRLKENYEGIEKLCLLTETELEAWIKAGRITDGFTLAAWTLLKASK